MARDELMMTAYEMAMGTLGLNGIFDDEIADEIKAASDESLQHYIDTEYDSYYQMMMNKLKTL